MNIVTRFLAPLFASFLGLFGVALPSLASAPSQEAARQSAAPVYADIDLLEYLTGECALGDRGTSRRGGV